MTQQNVNSGKTRPVRHRSAHRHSDPVHVHPAPSAPAPAAPVATPSPAAPAKKGSSFLGRWLGRGALLGGAAAVGTGIAVVG